MEDLIGIRKPGNAGLVTTTGGNDLLHTSPLTTINAQIFPPRRVILRKIMWSNNTGVLGFLSIGTLNATPVFVPFLPLITALTGFDGEMGEAELPAVEFTAATAQALAAVRFDGNIYVVTTNAAGAALAGLLVAIEVEEIGA